MMMVLLGSSLLALKFYLAIIFPCLLRAILRLLADFGENDFIFDLGLTWWINDIHGVSLEYNRAFDQEVDFIGLKYLYSWQ